MKHAEVPEALELVVDEVGKESQRIRDAGSVALKEGKLKPAKKAIEYAEKLLSFVDKVRRLGEEWDSLQQAIDSLAPEVREIVLPQKVRASKTGYKRNVGKIAPKTNFSVTFPDGKVIEDKKASIVFGKTIARLGASQVAAFNILLGGEPLVSRDESVFKKHPSQVLPIGNGWFVKTHNSTASKISLLEKISTLMNVKIKVQDTKLQKVETRLVKPSPNVPKVARKYSTQPKSAEQKFPYAVGQVVQAVFPALQTDLRMTEAHVAMLLAQSSSAQFKTGGRPVLKPNSGDEKEILDSNGRNRYYSKLPLVFFGKKYWLTSQFQPRAIVPTLAWFKEIGLGKGEILALCQKRWG